MLYLVNKSKVAIDTPIVNDRGDKDSIQVMPNSSRGAEVPSGWKIDPSFLNTSIQQVER